MGNAQDGRRLAAYLLGELPEAEEQELENRYFEDEALFEQLRAAEAELVDAYVAGELSALERRRLEARFLRSPRGPRELQFAEALESALRACRGTRIGTRAVSRRSARHVYILPAAAALVIGILIFALWNARQNSPRPRAATDGPAQVHPMASNGPTRENGFEPSQPGGRARPGPAAGKIVALALTPGLLRDVGPSAALALPADARQLRLTLRLETTINGACRVTLSTVEGREIWRVDGIRPQAAHPSRLVVDVPTNVVGAGDYIVAVAKSGGKSEEVADYYFRIVTRE